MKIDIKENSPVSVPWSFFPWHAAIGTKKYNKQNMFFFVFSAAAFWIGKISGPRTILQDSLQAWYHTYDQLPWKNIFRHRIGCARIRWHGVGKVWNCTGANCLLAIPFWHEKNRTRLKCNVRKLCSNLQMERNETNRCSAWSWKRVFGPENVLRRFMSEGIGHFLLFLTKCLFQFWPSHWCHGDNYAFQES